MIFQFLIRSKDGNASIEYALIAAFIGLGLLSGLKTLKNGLGTNYDKISVQIQRINNDTSGTRKEIGRDSPFTYFSNGIQVDQIWIRYDDGSSSLYRTSPTPAADFTSIVYDFGADGVNKGAVVQRKNGSSYTESYEVVRPNVTSVTYREGSSVATYLSGQVRRRWGGRGPPDDDLQHRSRNLDRALVRGLQRTGF